ncbi:MAG: YgjV family protein [Clostridia bacterium]|nr:YgjV family protein [Clostridia bacterium]
MSITVIANIISFVGATLMVLLGLLKSRKQILVVQSFVFAILGASNLLLGGISGVIANGVSIVRNAFSLKRDLPMAAKLGFVAVQIILTVFFNTNGLLGWLPVIAACMFTLAIDSKNPIVLKAVIIIGQAAWALFDFVLMNYSAFVFDVVAVITNALGIVFILRDRKAVNS